MARLICISGSDAHALLSAAAAPFWSPGPCVEPLPLLAVRQGGLRDAVHQLAADSAAIGWFGQPIVVFSDVPALFAGDLAPLDDLEREALVRRAMHDVSLSALGGTSIRATVAESLDRLFGDLVAAGVTDAGAAESLAAAQHGEWEGKRNADIAAVYGRYLELLAALPARAGVARTDGRDGLLQAARAIVERPTLAREGLRRPLRSVEEKRSIDIYGLADLRRGWRALLQALHAAPFIEELRVYIADSSNATGTEERDIESWLRDHADEARVIRNEANPSPALRHLGATLFTLGGATAQPSSEVSVTAAPDIIRELESVASKVKSLLSAGRLETTRPSEIAVVARKARPYLTSAADVFARYGIPFSARLRHNLTDVPVIAALLRCMHAAAGGWTSSGLREIGGSPYFTTNLDAGVLGYAAARLRPSGLTEWIAALESLEAEARANEDEFEGPAPGKLRSAADAIRQVDAHLSSFTGTKRATDWITLTLSAIGADSARAARAGMDNGLLGLAINAHPTLTDESPSPLVSAARIDSSALRKAEEVLLSWKRALVHDPDGERTLTLGEWVQALEATLSKREVTVRTGIAGGVHLLEALAADGRSFEHVFVLGMSVGAFPAEPLPEALIADDEKVALFAKGLPIEPARIWFSREAALWYSLARSARRSLALSYSYADANGAPQLGAAYLDEVVSRYDATLGGAEPGAKAADWVTRIPGSYVIPSSIDEIWSLHELDLLTARSLRGDACQRDALLGFSTREAKRVEEVARLLALAGVADTRASMRVAARAPDFDRCELANSWNGLVEDPVLLDALRRDYGDRVWSATQLEAYGRCPFAFFAKYALGVRQTDVVEDEEGARYMGAVMHSVLGRVYGRLVSEFGDEALSSVNADRARGIVADECEKELLPGETAQRGILRGRAREMAATLSDYVVWEMKQNRKAPRVPLRMEQGFGVYGADSPVVTLQSEGRTIKLRGRIDRVDRMLVAGAEEYLYVVDHKSGGSAFKGLTNLQPAGAVLQLALYIAALREIEPKARIWGGAYQLVRGLERKAPIDRCSAVKAGVRELGNATQQKAQATIDGAAGLALSITDGITAGRFPARVPEKVDCLQYCDFRDVCREERVKSW